MWTVVFRPEARRDMAKATKWYAGERAELGAAFADALDTTIARVLENPYMYAIVTRRSRRAPVPGFQHGVFLPNRGQSRRRHGLHALPSTPATLAG